MKLSTTLMCVLGMMLGLACSTSVLADQGGKGKDKHGASMIDISRLPPELARALQKYLHELAKDGQAKGTMGHPANGKDQPKGPPVKGKKDDPKGKEEAKGKKGDKHDAKKKDDDKGPPPHAKSKGKDDKYNPRAIENLTLSAAIAIAERAAGGIARKAEWHDKGAEPEFRIEVISADGARTRVLLDSRGRRIEHPEEKKGKDE